MDLPRKRIETIMHKAFIYIALGTIVCISKIYGEEIPEYTNLMQDSPTKVDLIYTNLEPQKQILYDKLDKHINYISQDLYDYCVNNRTTMNSSVNNAIRVKEQINTCMVSSLNSFSYNQNPEIFIQMMNKLKIIKKDWEYANALYLSIIYNKYSTK